MMTLYATGAMARAARGPSPPRGSGGARGMDALLGARYDAGAGAAAAAADAGGARARRVRGVDPCVGPRADDTRAGTVICAAPAPSAVDAAASGAATARGATSATGGAGARERAAGAWGRKSCPW